MRIYTTRSDRHIEQTVEDHLLEIHGKLYSY